MRVLAPGQCHLPLGGLGAPGEELHSGGEEGDHLGVLDLAGVSCRLPQSHCGFRDVVKVKKVVF